MPAADAERGVAGRQGRFTCWWLVGLTGGFVAACAAAAVWPAPR